jgi:HK97 family phage portal protein
MKSPLGELAKAFTNQAKQVPYVSSRPSLLQQVANRNGVDAQLKAMGGVGTLFSIVDRNATAASEVRWRLYRKAASGKDEDRTEVTEHPALSVWNNPNAFYHQSLFIEAITQHLELVGETPWLAARDERFPSGPPVELWPIRPDRLRPVPHPERFISGWIYLGPDGERIPLETNEVIRTIKPCPWDPFRGLGAVQTILVDLQSIEYAAEWNKNFFENSAEPGGVVEVEEELSDPEWRRMRNRWEEQHRGVGRAHRVAFLEKGKWVDRKYSMADMQFAELRSVSREIIREAFHMPKAMLGSVDDVNRANAEANEVVFARWETKTRCDRLKDTLNSYFLPLFGTTLGDPKRYEFDFDNPVPADKELEAKLLQAKADAAEKLVRVGYDPAAVTTAVGLPDMQHNGVVHPTSPSAPVPAASDPPKVRSGSNGHHPTTSMGELSWRG